MTIPRRERDVGTVDMGRVTGRPLDEDAQYGIRQSSARSRNQKHKSGQSIILDII